MKQVTATEARKNWFTLLDEAARGEVIAIRRNDKNLILRLEKSKRVTPDYTQSIDFHDADEAETWGWEWKRPGKLSPVKPRRSGTRAKR
jgi:antitoxin (DNA-binding transcriptional repressor) of toxin-antitoxin stability system